MTDASTRDLARRLAVLEARVGSRGTQLEHSSIEDGALREFNLEGEQVAQYGKQFDGTNVAASLKGPPPPQPSTPNVQTASGGFLVGWDGLYADSPTTVSPMDWLRTDIVFGAAGFDPIATPPTMAIVSPRGGLALVAAPPGTYEVALVARSQSGTASLASATATVTALPAASAEDLATKVSTFWQDSPPPTSGRALGDLWFDTDDGNKPHNWTGAWSPQVLGDAAIGGVGVGKLLTGSVAAGVSVVAGDELGSHAAMTDSGFKVFVDDPVDFVPNEVVRMGSSAGDLFAITDAGGHVKASISETGGGAFTGLSVDATEFDAEDRPVAGLTIYGTEFMTLLATQGPGKVIAQAYYPSDYASPGITTEFGVAEVSWEANAGTSYMVYMNGLQWLWETSECMATVGLRYTIDGSTPSITSTLWDSSTSRGGMADSQVCTTPPIVGQMAFGTKCTVRLLLTIRRAYGSGIIQWVTNAATSARHLPRFLILEAGPDTEETWLSNPGGGTYASGSSGGSGAASPKQKYVSVWNASNSEGYTGSGAAETSDPDFKQGYSSADGDSHGVVVFANNAVSGETTKTVATAMSGATLVKAEVYLYANHWHYNSGGTALIRAYNSTSLSSATPTGTIKSSASWPKPGGRWVDITTIATTSIRGITVGKAGSTNLLYYGRFNGHAQSNKPQLRLTYTR